jgi:hypothetical protein
MARTKISEFSSTAASNTDIDSINIAEGCSPSGINDAIRELMAQLKDWQAGTSNDPYVVGSSGSLTLNQGTANGVLYLNGSKVATSGSALTFDGTNLALVASGNPTMTVKATGGGNDPKIYLTADTNSFVLNGAFSPSTDRLAFQYNSGELFCVESTGNFGIGTSTPPTRLAVEKANPTRGILLRLFNSQASSSGAQIQFTEDSVADWAIGQVPAVNAFAFYSGRGTGSDGTEVARFSSSGNFGLGGAPSAWSTFKALQISSTFSALNFSGTGGQIVTNSYYDGSAYKYQTTNPAGIACFNVANTGGFAWRIAPSGTAGNAITFTQALTLDASGNLLLGATSAESSSKFLVSGSTSTYNLMVMKDTQSATYVDNHYQVFLNSSGSTAGRISHTASTTVAYTTSSDYRLKNITGPITNSGAYIDSLNPVEGTWKADGSTFVGLIAHEVQEVSRTQVATGVKDGAEMQAMDYSNSELIANLIAEVKSLRQRVATLETK